MDIDLSNNKEKKQSKTFKKMLYNKLKSINVEERNTFHNSNNRITITDVEKENNSNIDNENIYLNINQKYSSNYNIKLENIKKHNYLLNNYKYKNINKIIKGNKESNFKQSIIKNINFNDNNIKEKNISSDEKYENEKIIKDIVKERQAFNNSKENCNNIKYNYNKYKRVQIIKSFIINILLCHFCIINTLINFELNINYKKIKYYSYEIKLKIKGTGMQNILSASSSYTYQCPDIIYQNNLIQDVIDCHYINIKEPDSEIKLIWNNIIIYSTKGMFYKCTEIVEVDMTKFDTSLVTDMSEMFYMCSSLKSLNVTNLDTEKVETFQKMFVQCTSLTSLNLESFTNPAAQSLYRMFYDCKNLEFINIKNFEENENMNIEEMFYNIPQNAVICLLSCPPPTNFIISSMGSSEVIISWEGYEFNKFIISYGLQNLLNPEDGDIIYVINKNSYTFTNLESNQRYNIYIKTDCGSKSSFWIGPLLISIEFYTMPKNSSATITTCSKVIYSPGGPNRNYSNS